jgi:hypothetical protein
MNHKKLHRFLTKIHRKFGRSNEAVNLVVTDLGNKPYIGLCEKIEEGWRITLDDDIQGEPLLHLLIHEYAHTMVPEYDKYHHGPTWGIAYAAIYSYIYDDVLLTPKRRKRKLSVGRSS